MLGTVEETDLGQSSGKWKKPASKGKEAIVLERPSALASLPVSEFTYAAVTQLVLVSMVVADAEQIARHERDSKKHGRLTDDMGRNGQYTAIGVLEGTMQCIFGHGRLLSAIKLGWTHILARIFPARLTPFQLEIVRYGENEFRSNLTPFEKFRQCRKLLDADPSLKVQDVAALLGLTPGALTRILAIGKVEPVFQEALQAGLLTQENVYQIARMEDSKERFEFLASKRAAADAREQESPEPPRAAPRPKATSAPIKARITIPVAGVTVNVCGQLTEMTVLVRALEAALEEARMVTDHCDVKSFARMMRQRAKGGDSNA